MDQKQQGAAACLTLLCSPGCGLWWCCVEFPVSLVGEIPSLDFNVIKLTWVFENVFLLYFTQRIRKRATREEEIVQMNPASSFASVPKHCCFLWKIYNILILNFFRKKYILEC